MEEDFPRVVFTRERHRDDRRRRRLPLRALPRHRGQLKRRMAWAAEEPGFAQAALERNRLRAVRSLLARQRISNEAVGTLDAIAVAVEERDADANAQVFQVRDGVLSDGQSFYVLNAPSSSTSTTSRPTTASATRALRRCPTSSSSTPAGASSRARSRRCRASASAAWWSSRWPSGSRSSTSRARGAPCGSPTTPPCSSSSSASATRRTASRSTHHRVRRDREMTESIFDGQAGIGPARKPSPAQALRLARERAGGLAARSSRRFRASPARSRASCTRRSTRRGAEPARRREIHADRSPRPTR